MSMNSAIQLILNSGTVESRRIRAAHMIMLMIRHRMLIQLA